MKRTFKPLVAANRNCQKLMKSIQASMTNEEARTHYTYMIGCTLGLFTHVAFLIVFWLLGYPILAYYNVFSIAAFGYGLWCLSKGDLVTATYLCVLFEVPLHAALATYCLGFETGFWLLSFLTVAIITIYPYFSRFQRFAIAGLVVFFFCVIAYFTVGSDPVYALSNGLSFLFLISNFLVLTIIVASMLGAYDIAVSNAEAALEREFNRAETLLHNILPVPIAERLKAQEDPLADNLRSVTVLFSDISGFTNMSRGLRADELVGLLNDLFTRFDNLVMEHGAEKIKTIGDAYMIATGLDGNDAHAGQMIKLAQDMHATFEEFRDNHGVKLGLRTGIHSGEVVAGVIGKQKFAYDLWGDTVNIASRMESSGLPDHIQITSQTQALLSKHTPVEPRGQIEIKGHAARQTYFLK